MQIFVTAISTDSGKTLCSAILTEAFQADYWKPIQSGLPRDTATVKELVTNKNSVFHKEAYLLNTPVSPHQSAAIDGIKIDLNKIILPHTDNHLIIEGAGGVLVPLNETDFVIDLPVKWALPVVVVVNFYLGSINHTLLTINELKRRNIKIAGLVFNRSTHLSEAMQIASEEIILKHTQLNVLIRIPTLQTINKQTVLDLAKELKKHLSLT
jgi:dethiobiotin synthetase